MEFTQDTLNIMFLLIPGFVSSLIFRCILPNKIHSQLFFLFEVLLFSALIYITVNLIDVWQPIAAIDKSTLTFTDNYKSIVWITLFTFAYPVIFGPLFLLTKWCLLKLIRCVKLPLPTNRHTAWHDAFVEQTRHIRLYLKDGRVIDGYPMYFTESNDGPKYIYLHDPTFFEEEKDDFVRRNMHGLLIHEEQIQFIEFHFNSNENIGVADEQRKNDTPATEPNTRSD